MISCWPRTNIVCDAFGSDGGQIRKEFCRIAGVGSFLSQKKLKQTKLFMKIELYVKNTLGLNTICSCKPRVCPAFTEPQQASKPEQKGETAVKVSRLKQRHLGWGFLPYQPLPSVLTWSHLQAHLSLHTNHSRQASRCSSRCSDCDSAFGLSSWRTVEPVFHSC